MDAARFPAVTGEALDGTPFAAPRDIAGGRMVALFGFALDHRTELESWIPFLDEVARAGKVRVRLFVPLGVPKLLRGSLVGAMKAGVTQPELRASTIPLFVDVEAFCRALGIAERTHLNVLLIEPDGSVAWRGTGSFTDAARAALTQALAV